MGNLFHTFIYLPIHNLLVFLVDIVPGGDLGVAVILVTLAIKFVLMPLSLSAVKTQRMMRVIDPEMKELREKYKDDRETQAREMLALYKKYGVKPFSSILLLIIQIPIVLGLYFVAQGATLTALDPSLLYSFVAVPTVFSTNFLGVFSVTTSSIALAVIAGITQFLYATYAIPVPPKSEKKNPSMQDEFARAMAMQARFMFPLLIALFSYTSGALALYFAASNLFMVAQEFIARTFFKHPEQKVEDVLPVPTKLA